MHSRYDVETLIAIIEADMFIDNADVFPCELHQHRSDEYRKMLGRFLQTILASSSNEAIEFIKRYIQTSEK